MKRSGLASPEDERWMREALKYSQAGLGWTSPRPAVGCVIVREGRVLGGGHTSPGSGNPHAEINALNQARANGEETRGATAYVTLEPCSHFATTPPCSQALIKAGITRVVAGVRDPNPEVDGRGYEQLREAGVEVVEGCLQQECARIHDQFLKHIVYHTPFVTLKAATSLDGKIALPSGESKWITSRESRRRGHLLRHEHDAVLVGIETVLSDDPRLNVRLEGYQDNQWKQPAKVVLDSRGRFPSHAALLGGVEEAPLYIATTEAMPQEKRKELEKRGAKVLLCPSSHGRVHLSELLKTLYQHEIYSVLIEGGARVASSMLQENLVDKLMWFMAPILIGKGREALGDYTLSRLAGAPRLRDVQTERIGDEILWSGYFL